MVELQENQLDRVLHDSSINVTETDGEFEVAKVENHSDELTRLCDMSLREACHLKSNFELLELMCVVVSDPVWRGP